MDLCCVLEVTTDDETNDRLDDVGHCEDNGLDDARIYLNLTTLLAIIWKSSLYPDRYILKSLPLSQCKVSSGLRADRPRLSLRDTLASRSRRCHEWEPARQKGCCGSWISFTSLQPIHQNEA